MMPHNPTDPPPPAVYKNSTGSPTRDPEQRQIRGIKGISPYICEIDLCARNPPLSHQLPSQPGQSDQQTGDFAHFTQQRSYGRQFAYSSCSEPNMGRLGVYHDHLAAQSILVND